MSKLIVNLFLGAMIGTARTGPDKRASVTRKIGEKSLSCLLDVEPLSKLSPDNVRPRLFKSVAGLYLRTSCS